MAYPLYLVSGPSGSGKTTLMREVLTSEIVSFTTRPPRVHEQYGVDYYFISSEEFDRLHRTPGAMVESTHYGDFDYGIFAQEVENKTAKAPTYSVVDVNGMRQLKLFYAPRPVVTIFLYASREDLVKQLRLRGEMDEFITKRLALYDQELSTMPDYDYVVKNQFGEQGRATALHQLQTIIRQYGG